MDRAVAPVISTILLVAIAVILAATISVFVLGFGEEVEETAPVVGQSSGEFVGDISGSNDQIVRIRHVAGDSIDVSNMEIVVSTCGKTTRITNLPATRYTPTYIPFDENRNFEGDQDLISEGQPGQSWNAGVLHEDTDNTFKADAEFEFRINNAPNGCDLSPGDRVTVRVIHVPTNAVVIEQELTAR